MASETCTNLNSKLDDILSTLQKFGSHIADLEASSSLLVKSNTQDRSAIVQKLPPRNSSRIEGLENRMLSLETEMKRLTDESGNYHKTIFDAILSLKEDIKDGKNTDFIVPNSRRHTEEHAAVSPAKPTAPSTAVDVPVSNEETTYTTAVAKPQEAVVRHSTPQKVSARAKVSAPPAAYAAATTAPSTVPVSVSASPPAPASAATPPIKPKDSISDFFGDAWALVKTLPRPATQPTALASATAAGAASPVSKTKPSRSDDGSASASQTYTRQQFLELRGAATLSNVAKQIPDVVRKTAANLSYSNDPFEAAGQGWDKNRQRGPSSAHPSVYVVPGQPQGSYQQMFPNNQQYHFVSFPGQPVQQAYYPQTVLRPQANMNEHQQIPGAYHHQQGLQGDVATAQAQHFSIGNMQFPGGLILPHGGGQIPAVDPNLQYSMRPYDQIELFQQPSFVVPTVGMLRSDDGSASASRTYTRQQFLELRRAATLSNVPKQIPDVLRKAAPNLSYSNVPFEATGKRWDKNRQRGPPPMREPVMPPVRRIKTRTDEEDICREVRGILNKLTTGHLGTNPR